MKPSANSSYLEKSI